MILIHTQNGVIETGGQKFVAGAWFGALTTIFTLALLSRGTK